MQYKFVVMQNIRKESKEVEERKKRLFFCHSYSFLLQNVHGGDHEANGAFKVSKSHISYVDQVLIHWAI